MYKSQFRKTNPYGWFCGPGSHIVIFIVILYNVLGVKEF